MVSVTAMKEEYNSSKCKECTCSGTCWHLGDQIKEDGSVTPRLYHDACKESNYENISSM